MKENIATIIISPHADDTAFSIGGLLCSNFFEKPAIMVTVFTRSNYAPFVKSEDVEKISNIRCLEDISFADRTGIKLHRFNFPEAPLRGKVSKADIFRNVEPESDPLFWDVYSALAYLIKSYPEALVVSPIGIMNHIDHLIVAEVCSRICEENNFKIMYYEDLPYAGLFALKEIENMVKALNPKLQPIKIDVTNSFYNKLLNIKIYKSQIQEVPMLVKLHAMHLNHNNESKTEQLLWKYSLYRYIFYYTHYINTSLFERIWHVP